VNCLGESKWTFSNYICVVIRVLINAAQRNPSYPSYLFPKEDGSFELMPTLFFLRQNITRGSCRRRLLEREREKRREERERAWREKRSKLKPPPARERKRERT
jgi:hypothetical protein